MSEDNIRIITWASIGAGIFAAALIVYVFHDVLYNGDAGFGGVAALVLVGFAAFLGLMNILSYSANHMGITDAKQAFGLPEGSVRAVLTIAFIVLVGVLASYLLTNSDRRASFDADKPIVLLGQVTSDVAQQKGKEYSSADGLIAITPAGENKFDVKFYPKIDHRLGDDISKQILTMLTTILAAMIGFYFGGSRPVGAEVKPPPVDAEVKPPPGVPHAKPPGGDAIPDSSD